LHRLFEGGRKQDRQTALLNVPMINKPTPFSSRSRRRLLASLIAILSFGICGVGFAAEKADQVIIKKGARKMMLMKNGKVLRSYRIALGARPTGHKQQQGDERTPEGNYTLDYRNPGSKFHRSIHVSYPNAKDRAAAKKRGVSPGGEIFVHGVPGATPDNQIVQAALNRTNWTDGCIAVTNDEMDEIWAMVSDGTPIRIDP
jgi:murein L,D-transpeptidase YafK